MYGSLYSFFMMSIFCLGSSGILSVVPFSTCCMMSASMLASSAVMSLAMTFFIMSTVLVYLRLT